MGRRTRSARAARSPLPHARLDSTKNKLANRNCTCSAAPRLAWEGLPWVGRKLVEIAERLADREPIQTELRRGARELAEELTNCRGEAEELTAVERRFIDLNSSVGKRAEPEPTFEHGGWGSLAHLVYFPFAGTTPNYRRIAKDELSLELFRDVFPNPFRDARIRSEWQDRTVVGIARGVCATRDFSPLPLLADALEDAGCANDHVLDHCRCRGPTSAAAGLWKGFSETEGEINEPRRMPGLVGCLTDSGLAAAATEEAAAGRGGAGITAGRSRAGGRRARGLHGDLHGRLVGQPFRSTSAQRSSWS